MNTTNTNQLHTAGLVVLKAGKLLLAFSNNKKAWYLPGGKVAADETAHDAICREVKEELDVELLPDQLKFYCHITAPAYGENPHIIMEQDCFLYHLTEPVKASNEISEVRYFDFQAYLREPAQVPGVLQLFAKLTGDGLI
ncbi:NUDIX domain-containing protein [Olivibacter sp. SDN3]|uniref:NUDIX hydrolase n=1 Tax=Olivibacter sp. SDN3 TaxID=2764720 RepID=UPI001650E18C|nr:NUDIX domain-containing protein [Olivibacter sp. SDN3]QNL48001.1 NUDIX domain-containing protein [Olivibacter sp. SDN3]